MNSYVMNVTSILKGDRMYKFLIVGIEKNNYSKFSAICIAHDMMQALQFIIEEYYNDWEYSFEVKEIKEIEEMDEEAIEKIEDIEDIGIQSIEFVELEDEAEG